MRILFLIILATALLIGMFYWLEGGGIQRDKNTLLDESQRQQLKDAMKPPKKPSF